MRQITLAHPQNKLEKELIKLFHSTNLPLHTNKTGNKEFTNYQRISVIVLFYRSKKSLRDFVDELNETKWISWLGLRKSIKKSTLHDWLKKFSLKKIREFCKSLLPKNIEIASIDSTGIDAWQRSRHYEKRCEEFKKKKLPPMNYAKTSLFIDVKTQIILDWDLEIFKVLEIRAMILNPYMKLLVKMELSFMLQLERCINEHLVINHQKDFIDDNVRKILQKIKA